ncbi:DUF3054 domain-containing protein [Aestuariimicrobium ganziense]|uniref:DUF3054 domain-containing protein n=1 Tax=Aestuariimicrobium ganziense TaxID=2773677 RepID=UPI00194055BE|nr:DUF3054 domain-containing protein [Aestuariimicrobium ganziense]
MSTTPGTNSRLTTKHGVIIDLLLVALFALIGRASHSESLTPSGVFQTAWPFLFALVVGWAVMLVRRRRAFTLGAGVFLWVVTVAGGMVLRVSSGDTAATAFIIVATLVLGAFLVGWRLLFGRRFRETGAEPEGSAHA